MIQCTALKTLPHLTIGFTILVTGCGDRPCDETLTCDVPGAAGTGGSGATTTGSQGPSTGGSGTGGGAGPDTEAPTVVSVSPPNGATGVTDDATILITFSEPMDRSSTQNALQASSLGGVTFNWPDDRTLEIIPTGLSYAQGGHDVVSNQYQYGLTTFATDLAGNPLANDETWAFSTLRRVSDLLSISQLSASGSGALMPCTGTSIRVGQADATTCRLLMQISLAPVPIDAQIENARLSCQYFSAVGELPLSSTLDHITYAPGDPSMGYYATALSSFPDPFNFGQAGPPSNPFSVDVTPAIASELKGTTPAYLQMRFSIDVPPTFADRYLHWGTALNSGCKDGASIVYLSP